MPDEPLPDIEQRVAHDRAALARSLERLGNTLAPDRLKREAAQAADRIGSDIGQQAWTAARDNPAAFALVGAGLALLLSGKGSRQEESASFPASGDRSQNEARPTSVVDAHAAHLQTSDARIKARPGDRSRKSAPSARRMRADLHSGLDRLPAQARTRILKAREAAVSAQQAVEHRAAKIAGQADTIVRENPATVTAAAFGLGALFAALLPSTRSEDDMLGAHRDAMMAKAQTALHDEISRLKSAASDPVRDTLSDDGAGLQVPS